jgi:hypothetical protein
MKTLSILILFLISVTSSFSQSGKITSKTDSVDVELERTNITFQQIQLRDSIDQSLAVFNVQIEQAPKSKKKELEKARKELLLNKEILQRDIDEVGLTSKNSWTKENVKRLKINTAQVRREYRRIRKNATKI